MPDPEPQPQPQPAPQNRASVPEVFSADYVRELRAENGSYRTRINETEQKLTAAEQRAKDAETAAQAKITEAAAAAQQRIIKAELRVAAKDAGAVDAADVVALLGTAKVKTDADGNVTNAAELLEELKKAKPHLFGGASSSSTAKEPAKEGPKTKKATEMTDDEYKVARAAVLAGR
jgi:hypothetical protein